MWSKLDYEILMASLKRGGHIQAEHKPIFLDELIQMSKGYSRSFLKELKDYHIKVKDRYNLHYSKFKVKYLSELYFAAKKVYSVFLKREGYWFMKSCTGDMIHTVECDVGGRIPVKYRRESKISDAFDGYKLCDKCCKDKLKYLPDREHVRFPLKKQFHEEQISKMCKEFGMKYSLAPGIIFVETNYSYWRLFHDEYRITQIYHENLRVENRKNEDLFNEGFHKQKIELKNVYDVLNYIHIHERKLYENMRR